MLEICLLGTGGSVPKPDRWLSSAFARHVGKGIIIDCGEGTQLALKEAGYAAGQICLILITHFHADHVSGLPGLLLAMANEGRVDPVTVAGPKGTERIVRSLCVIAAGLPFQVVIHEFASDGGDLPPELFEGSAANANPMKISAFPCRHSMPCLGYRLSLARAGKFDPEKAKALGIPMHLWGILQRGGEVADGERVYTSDTVMGPPRRGIDVSYVTDTRPTDTILKNIAWSDLLICEAMFGDDKPDRAAKTRHMTASEAATLAYESGARRLWLTHYSPSVPDPAECLVQARKIYPEAIAGCDGMKETLMYE